MLCYFGFKKYCLISISAFSALLTSVAIAATSDSTNVRGPGINNTNADSLSPTTNTPYTLSTGTGTAYVGSIGTSNIQGSALSATTAGKLLKWNTQNGVPIPLIGYYQQTTLGDASSDTSTKFGSVRNTFSVVNQEQLVATLNKTCRSNFTVLPKLNIKSYEVFYYALDYYEDTNSPAEPQEQWAKKRWVISTEPNQLFSQHYIADWRLQSPTVPSTNTPPPVPIWSVRAMPLPNDTIISGLSLMPIARINSPANGQTQFLIKAPASGDIGYISTPLPTEIYVTEARVLSLQPPGTDASGQQIYWTLDKKLSFRRSYNLNKLEFNTVILKVNYEWQVDCVATSAGP